MVKVRYASRGRALEGPVEVGDVVEITATVTNEGDETLENGKLTFSKGKVVDGEDYTHEGAVATIASLTTEKPVNVKAEYTIGVADVGSFNVIANFECSELTAVRSTSDITEPIVVDQLPALKATGYASTKAEANKVLSGYGDPVTDCGDHTFYAVFDKKLGSAVDYLLTVKAGAHTYGITAPAKDRTKNPNATRLYFTLNTGKQVDFVDGVAKESDEAASYDLSIFDGTVTFSVYRTDKQEPGQYPKGLVQLKTESIRITPTCDARASIVTDKELNSLQAASIGTFEITGTVISGEANKVTAQNWSKGSEKQGYFVPLHFDNAKKIYTAEVSGGRALDESGDVLFLLGEKSITAKYIEADDENGDRVRYAVAVTTSE